MKILSQNPIGPNKLLLYGQNQLTQNILFGVLQKKEDKEVLE